jgi:hypothetical protein
LTGDVAVRWIAPADGSDLLRIVGSTGQNLDATSIYDIELLETTVFVPRWNNSSTQITIFLIQNTTNAAVTGNIDFYQPGGLLQDSQALNVPANGSQILNTSTFPGLAGLSGVAQIAHDGNYGAIIGKAVAVEPATGFTFDTPFVSLPR